MVLGEEVGLLDEVLGGGVQSLGCLAQGRWRMGGDVNVQGLEAGTKDAVVGLGEEESYPTAVESERVAELAWYPPDEALAAEAPQIVAHLPGGVVGVGDSRELGD